MMGERSLSEQLELLELPEPGHSETSDPNTRG